MQQWSIELTVSSFHYRKFYNSISPHFEIIYSISQDSGISKEKPWRDGLYWKKSVVFPLMEISFAMLLIAFLPFKLIFLHFSQLYTPLSRTIVISFLAFLPRFPHFQNLSLYQRYQHSFLSLDFLVSTIPFRISYRGRIASSNIKIFQVSISSR